MDVERFVEVGARHHAAREGHEAVLEAKSDGALVLVDAGRPQRYEASRALGVGEGGPHLQEYQPALRIETEMIDPTAPVGGVLHRGPKAERAAGRDGGGTGHLADGPRLAVELERVHHLRGHTSSLTGKRRRCSMWLEAGRRSQGRGWISRRGRGKLRCGSWFMALTELESLSAFLVEPCAC